MNSERQQAYLNLINQLLNSPSGEEAEVLKTHPELLDDGLVVAMLEEADNLREQGKLNNANRLKDFARLLGKVDGDFLAGITLKAEANRLLKQGIQHHKLSQFREALQSWEQALTIYREIGYRQGEANSLGSLGIAYQSLGQFQKAIEFYEQSLEISREIKYRQGEAISLNNLGNALLKTNQLAEAETALRGSIKISETLRSELVNNDHKASIFETQVSAYRNLQKVLVARSQFNEALEISEMSRTRAFVELLQQTLLITPLSPPLSRGGRRVISIPPSGAPP
ncbi:MAG: tetratricopeptide repeat protein [Oscillatoriales cyanobacterium]|nr:MAG: tetratricopeptide repeat protein [Oscillatoriales cyanobacterium]TAE98455.1 MAG: tetratricopeptide repeat protein [Oscillatoriales cyanobacterium]TAF40437.1 MAG: tetratricopeptide repeat protein [Oscillatoriales cyanobacterium]TAF62482.1 MAG: tetratricopeptide repeat protein [Oscillatoriales cyanobacterium]